MRISVRDANNHNVEIAQRRQHEGSHPGDAVRERSIPASSRSSARSCPVAAASDFDTAVYAGIRANYTVTIDSNGTLGDPTDDIVTITDNVGVEGTDRLTNIERLQFADQSVVLVPGLNDEPVGLLTILDAATNTPDGTPAEDQLLRVSIAGVTDADNPGGTITGPISYVWQFEPRPGDGIFEDITFAGGEGDVTATGPTFRPTQDLVGLAIRVKATYRDANGVLETVFSAPTAAVENTNDAPAGSLAISDTTPTEGQLLTAFNSITDADGLVTSIFTYQWQSSVNGTDWLDIENADGADIPPGQCPRRPDVAYRGVVHRRPRHRRNRHLRRDGAGPEYRWTTARHLARQLLRLRECRPGEVIAQVTVDDDIGDTHTFVVSDPRFEIVGGQLRLVAGASLDDPDVGFLSMTITVTDQLGYSADFPVGLVILNVNEAPTRIVLDPAVVSENALGAVIGTMSVLDPDFGDVHSFTLSDARFEVVDGVLKLRDDQSLNFEAEPTVTFSVTATDQLGLSKTSDFTILVADLNDSTPTITGTNVANTLNGTAGNDHIAGLGGNDTINGLAGNDILDGGTGADTMVGGTGNDIYMVDTATDTVTENAGAGNDTVKTGLSTYTLGNNVENLIYTGAGTFSGTGNGLANAISGGNANDTITGGGGIDLLIGNGGNDSINGNAGDDAIYGGAGNDTLTGEAGDDMLSGGADNDILIGGAGADYLNGDGGTDTASYATSTTAVTASLRPRAINTGDAAGDIYVGIENLTGGTGRRHAHRRRKQQRARRRRPATTC